MRSKERFNGELYRRSTEAIAHGALTNSKRPESFVKGIYPTHLKKGKGCYVWDTNDNQYLDFICGLGSNLLGYAYDDICDAIDAQSRQGTVLSLGTELEIRTAERVKEFVPFVESVRFLKTGSDACTAALTIARSYTRRFEILSSGYHGWHPEFTSLTLPAWGVTPHADIKAFDKVEDIHNRIAAIIVEPIETDLSDGRLDYLRAVRKRCTDIGALLIFDEVITGFRFPQYSVAQEYDIIPDIICLGKAVANGMPLSIVAGKKSVMESRYFVSSTFAGETLSLASALKTMDLLQNRHQLSLLWEKGAQFLFRFNEIWREGLSLQGYPTRAKIVGDDLTKALFMQECCKAGILVGPSFFFIFPHIEVMDEALSTFSDILNRIKRGEVRLLGEMPQTPFAQRVRGDE